MRGGLVLVLGLCMSQAAAAQGAARHALATVRERAIPVQYRGYAQIEPIGTLTVHALLEGTLGDFHLVPGEAVRRGQLLGRVVGPGFAQARAGAAQARTELSLARRRLASVRGTYPGMSSRNELDAARAAVTEARQRLSAATARLKFLESGAAIRAPRAGTVLATFVVDGEQVAQGAPLLRLQARGGLWVKGVFYGAAAAALHPGMHGRFEPALGGAPIALTVRSVLAPMRPDGGRAVGCEPRGKPNAWVDGTAGTLILNGPARRWALVPTPSLVMDAGHWWVLVAEGHGARRVRVMPGAREGGWTAVRGPLKSGDEVVVQDVYRRFHSDFSRHFQNPD